MNINYSPTLIKAAAELKGIDLKVLATLLNCTESTLKQWTDASQLALTGPNEVQEGALDVSRIDKLYSLLGLELSEEQDGGVRHLVLPNAPVFYLNLDTPYSPDGEGDCRKLNVLLEACQKAEFTYVEPRKKRMFGLKANACFLVRFTFEANSVCYAVVDIKGTLFGGFGLNPEEMQKATWAPVGETVALSAFTHEAAFLSKTISAETFEEVLAAPPVKVLMEEAEQKAVKTEPSVQANQEVSNEEVDEQTLKLAKLLAEMVKSGKLDLNTLTINEPKAQVQPEKALQYNSQAN